MKEDDKKLDAIKKSGSDMIEFLRMENKKLQEQMQGVKAERKVRRYIIGQGS